MCLVRVVVLRRGRRCLVVRVNRLDRVFLLVSVRRWRFLSFGRRRSRWAVALLCRWCRRRFLVLLIVGVLCVWRCYEWCLFSAVVV